MKRDGLTWLFTIKIKNNRTKTKSITCSMIKFVYLYNLKNNRMETKSILYSVVKFVYLHNLKMGVRGKPVKAQPS